MSRLAVIGAGGHAKVVLATLQAAGIDVDAVLDDDEGLWSTELLGVRVRGPIAELDGGRWSRGILAVGDNRTRSRFAADLGTPREIEWVPVVHPAAVVHPSARLGPGAVVFAGAVVQPDARLGAHVIVNTGATVDHDCRLCDFVHLGPGGHLAGTVRVDEGAFLGIGSSVLPGVRIGAWATVGAGAVVVSDVEPGATVRGVPAR